MLALLPSAEAGKDAAQDTAWLLVLCFEFLRAVNKSQACCFHSKIDKKRQFLIVYLLKHPPQLALSPHSQAQIARTSTPGPERRGADANAHVRRSAIFMSGNQANMSTVSKLLLHVARGQGIIGKMQWERNGLNELIASVTTL